MEAVEASLKELAEMRDSFFEKRPATASIEDRQRFVKENALRLLQEVPIPSAEAASKARYQYMCGRILNCPFDYDVKCEEALVKAVKLEPDLWDAWNELGECLWKKADRPAALNCFRTSTDKHKNGRALRCMSIALRQEAGASANKASKEQFRESLTLAEQAAALEPGDADSWYVLGNGNLTYFFASSQESRSHLEKALNAYRKSLSCTMGRCYNADLYFNFAQALKFEQNYSEALSQLSRAVSLDPTFNSAIDAQKSLVSLLVRMDEAVRKKGKLRSKRLLKFEQVLRSKEEQSKILQSASSAVDTTLSICSLKQLNGDLQMSGRLLLAKVVGMVPNSDVIPYCFAAVDCDGEAFVCTVYNFSEHFGTCIGDTIAIFRPIMFDVDVTISSQRVKFCCFRILSPESMSINGRWQSKLAVAACDASVTVC